MARLVALIPAHNEILTIAEVVAATRAHLADVIVIDDGSTDGTADAARGAGARVLCDGRNLGKGARLREGMDLAFAEGASHVLTLDADGQHDPDDIPAFARVVADDPEALVLGDRSSDMDRMPADRRRAIRFGNFFISWACERRLDDAQCGMRVYPAVLRQRARIPERHGQGFVFESMVLLYAARAGFAFRKVAVAARYDGFVHRASHFRPWDVMRITAAITEFIIARGFIVSGLLQAIGLRRYKHKVDA